MNEKSRLVDLGIDYKTLEKYNKRIPRYTSYPTVPSWSDEFDSATWLKHLRETSTNEDPLSLYIHIPFCKKHCLFCACNVIITQKQGIADRYLDTLEKEITLIRDQLQKAGKVIQLHLGGGTPNYLNSEQMQRLINFLESKFDFDDNAERSIEVDPRTADPEYINNLKNKNHFNRISFGVQDLHDATQQAIGREQTRDITFTNVEAARSSGFESVNIDLIYGLPEQTLSSWKTTIEGVLSLQPDRIALYNFAFLPSKLAHQRAIEDTNLPEAEQKVEMFMMAHDALTENGWAFIGMDHYARLDDTLTEAVDQGSMRRNFMGYTTLRGTDMLSFGVSAISDYKGAFAQNSKKITVQEKAISENKLPVERGMKLSDDDLHRRECIETIMCSGKLPLVDKRTRAIIEENREVFETLESEGLINLSDEILAATLKGRVFLRNIAVLFDAYYPEQAKQTLFSKAV